ncbi:MAG: hypothetical protein HC837_01585 [Chloroflexaceae bacterium]|nr:hypothetical protein [Chloroflexaceae bacterium]
MACRVLPGLTVAAAMRANEVVQTPEAPTNKPAPRTLLPIGQRSRLAAAITDDAGSLLHYPFTPYQHPEGRAGLLSVAGLRHTALTPCVPPLTVSRGSLPLPW